MEAEFNIVLPKYDNSGNPITDTIIKDITHNLTKRFGGATIIPTILGCYNDSERNKLQCENNVKISVARDCNNIPERQCHSILRHDYDFIKNDVAQKVGKQLGQNEIFVQMDNVVDNSLIKGNWESEVSMPLRRTWKNTDWFDVLI